MRTVALVFMLTVSLLGRTASADEQPKPPPLPPAQEHTTVRGSPPADLVGRWLVIGWIDVPGGKARTTTALWEIAQNADQLVLTNRFADLPEAQSAAMIAANQAEEPWRPTPADVAAVAAAWDSLASADPRLTQIENEIVTHDAFDASFQHDALSKDAVWVVRQSEVFDASAAPAMKQINVYSALGPKDGGWAGNYTAATIAAAPFPIPITLHGTFEAYRLSGTPSGPRGFVARLLDLFSGCGRR